MDYRSDLDTVREREGDVICICIAEMSTSPAGDRNPEGRMKTPRRIRYPGSQRGNGYHIYMLSLTV